MPSRTAIYIRVSTQEQAMEGYSIQAQTERLQAYCKAKGWGVFHAYTDAGFSGSNMQRPALSQLLDDVEAGRVDCVLVYKLDRLSRSQKDTLHMIEDVFLDHGCDFVSMSENFDTSTPLGRAMIGILSVFAQLEREQIRERMAMGRTERAKSGLWQGGGWVPIGYDYVDGRLVPNPVRAAAVRDIYDLFLAGTPITSIKLIVNKKYALNLADTTVRSVLSHRLYVGDIVWMGNVYKGQMPSRSGAGTPRPKRPSCADWMKLTPTPRDYSTSTSAAWPSIRLPIDWMRSTRKKQPCRSACKNSAWRKKPPATRKSGWSRNGRMNSWASSWMPSTVMPT